MQARYPRLPPGADRTLVESSMVRRHRSSTRAPERIATAPAMIEVSLSDEEASDGAESQDEAPPTPVAVPHAGL